MGEDADATAPDVAPLLVEPDVSNDDVEEGSVGYDGNNERIGELERIAAATEESKASLSANHTLESMDNAIQGIRDWQANRKEAISKLEMEHAQMLEQYARKSAASSPAAGVGTSSRRQDDDDDALVQINLLEAELAQCRVASASTRADEARAPAPSLSTEYLKLLTSASAMSFAAQSEGRAEDAVGGSALADHDAALREADALLGSPGGGGPSGGPLPGGDEDALLAWNADLQSVLSKLDILETTHESRAKAGGLGSP